MEWVYFEHELLRETGKILRTPGLAQITATVLRVTNQGPGNG